MHGKMLFYKEGFSDDLKRLEKAFRKVADDHFYDYLRELEVVETKLNNTMKSERDSV